MLAAQSDDRCDLAEVVQRLDIAHIAQVKDEVSAGEDGCDVNRQCGLLLGHVGVGKDTDAVRLQSL
jgi:hypothetical protein